MLVSLILLTTLAATADKPTPSADVFNSPEFQAKVAAEQEWLASLPPRSRLAPAESATTTTANSTRFAAGVNGAAGVNRSLGDATTHTLVVCSAQEDNPISCKFTASSSGDYYFVFSKATGLAFSVVGAVSIDHAYVGKKVYQYWNNCCDSVGGPGHDACKWDNKEVIRYSATCTPSNDFNGLAINLYLRSGESVQVLPSGSTFGFY